MSKYMFRVSPTFDAGEGINVSDGLGVLVRF